MYGSIPLTQWRNFCGFTFMDLSGELLIDWLWGKKWKWSLVMERWFFCFASKLLSLFSFSCHPLPAHTFTNAHVLRPLLLLVTSMFKSNHFAHNLCTWKKNDGKEFIKVVDNGGIMQCEGGFCILCRPCML
jgi:hypothetical protein